MNQTAAMENEGKGTAQQAATGPFEFFRKYQKIILYTAGLFTLVTFSITGALMGFFDTVFRPVTSYGTIEISGRMVDLTEEDYLVAQRLRQPGSFPTVVLPALGGDQDTRENMVDVLAMLRRAAIEAGIQVSRAEVDRAIDKAVQGFRVQGQSDVNATRVALNFGHASLEAFRSVVAEAMRIGNYTRLQALAADTSDAALVESLLENRERITLKVAQLDKEALQEELEEAGVSDEELLAWLEELDDVESARFRDTNHVALLVAGVRYDAFEAEPFAAELEGVEIGEERMLQAYERERERRFRKDRDEPPAPDQDPDQDPDPPAAAAGDPGTATGTQAATPPDTTPPVTTAQDTATQDPTGQASTTPDPATDPQDPDPYLPFEEVQEEVRELVQAEEVLAGFWRQIQAARSEHLQAVQQARDEARRQQTGAELNRAAAEEALAADPENAELQDELATAGAELEQRQAELEAAETALEAARASFDLRERFEELLGDRAGFGFVLEEVPEPTNADGLNPLPELGEWTDSWAATAMSSVGDLSSLVQRAEHGAFHFMVTELVERPLKPFEEIAEEVRAEYFARKADELAEEKGEAFEAALLRLARLEIPERVAELEAEKETRLEERFAAWRDGLQARLEQVRKDVEAIGDPRLVAYRNKQREIEELTAQLEDEEAKRAALAEEIEQEVEDEIAAEARAVYKDVLAAAAAEAGFVVVELPAHPRGLATQDPRFQYREDEAVKFLFRDQTVQDLEADEATELLDDPTGRALYLAVCTGVESVTLADLTRRDLLAARFGVGTGFPEGRLHEAFLQSFTFDALSKRFKYRPAPEDEETGS